MTSELPSRKVIASVPKRSESIAHDVDADRRYPMGGQHGSHSPCGRAGRSPAVADDRHRPSGRRFRARGQNTLTCMRL